MMRRPKRLLAAARMNGVQFVVRSLMVLGRAPSTVRNLWNRQPRKEPRLAHGCLECGILYRFDVFYWGDVKRLGRCPSCGCDLVLNLGHLPETTKDASGVYLIGRDGFCTGPYASEEDAQDHVWYWFAQKEHNGRQEGKEDNEEGGQEDHQEDIKDKRAKAWGRPRLVLDEGEVRFPNHKEDVQDSIGYGLEAERRRNRRVDGQDVEGQEVEGEGTDPTSE